MGLRAWILNAQAAYAWLDGAYLRAVMAALDAPRRFDDEAARVGRAIAIDVEAWRQKFERSKARIVPVGEDERTQWAQDYGRRACVRAAGVIAKLLEVVVLEEAAELWLCKATEARTWLLEAAALDELHRDMEGFADCAGRTMLTLGTEFSWTMAKERARVRLAAFGADLVEVQS